MSDTTPDSILIPDLGQARPRSSDAEIADRLYGSPEAITSTYAGQIGDSINRIADAQGLTKEQRAELLTETAVMFSDARIPSNPASTLHALIAHHTIEPPDQKTLQQWTMETRKEIRERYGDDGDRRLELARNFIEQRPGLKELLNKTGIGSHPRMVLALMENAHILRATPRPRGSKGSK